jgi:hypothetical protein
MQQYLARFGIPSLLALSITTTASADGFKMRAREHYETMRVTATDSDQPTTFSGFSNTINLWYEKPMSYAIGLAASPLWATLGVTGTKNSDAFGERIRLVHIGIEGKYFPLTAGGLFTRLGLYRATLQTNGLGGVTSGRSALAAIGYEWQIGRVGLALEWALRSGDLASGGTFHGEAPAIGVHFYQI